MSDTNLRSNGQLSTRESESRIKAARVKLVPLKLGWHNEVSISSPITDINGIPRLDWHTEVSIPTHMADVMRIPAYTFLVLLGKRVVHPGGRPSTEEMYRLARFQSGQRVLEVGCGAGTTAIEIASRFKESKKSFWLTCCIQAVYSARRRLKRTISPLLRAGVMKPLAQQRKTNMKNVRDKSYRTGYCRSIGQDGETPL